MKPLLLACWLVWLTAATASSALEIPRRQYELNLPSTGGEDNDFGRFWAARRGVPLVSHPTRTHHTQHQHGHLDNAALGAGTSGFGAAAAPPTPEPQTPNGTYALNVWQFGAKGDGKTDDTGAFQKALDESYRLGSLLVMVPPGQYVIRGNITIPQGSTLQGTYFSVPAHNSGQDATHGQPDEGSIILAYGGRGLTTNSCMIALSELSVFRGFTIYYPEQVPDKPPVPYPWSVCLNGINAAVTDVECLNCWNAVRAVQAHRHYIARIQGQPINMGIFVDQTYDIGRIEDVHFNPWYSSHPEYVAWQMLHGQSFVFARTDWEYVFNTFAFAYAVGYRFIESPTGACNGNFLGIGADMVANASVQVDAAQGEGILITNGEFTSFISKSWGKQYAEPTQILVSPSNTGAVRLSNTAFWGPSYQVAKISGSGTVGFMGCTLVDWDAAKLHHPAIEVVGGTGNLIVQGCDFMKKTKDSKHVSLGSTLARAVITGNTFETTMSIAGSAHNNQIGLNADDTAHSYP
ncbi:uncharacterized protein LOC135825089 [Sycon ciliatum]|uniref:uncharacterized protein LOC135825089 n=1 Tax=Sycon ciliatum TaxID=27933 RepID=UPI0031F6075A